MSKTLAEQEKPFLDALKARTGKDFAEWRAVIADGGVKGRNELMKWLQDVQHQEYIVAHRLTHLYQEHRELYGPKVLFSGGGRGGTVHFVSEEGSFDMWYELAGGDALAIIDVPKPQFWEANTKLPLAWREEILNFIGAEVVKAQTNGGRYTIGEDVLTIYSW